MFYRFHWLIEAILMEDYLDSVPIKLSWPSDTRQCLLNEEFGQPGNAFLGWVNRRLKIDWSVPIGNHDRVNYQNQSLNCWIGTELSSQRDETAWFLSSHQSNHRTLIEQQLMHALLLESGNPVDSLSTQLAVILNAWNFRVKTHPKTVLNCLLMIIDESIVMIKLITI